MAKKKAVKEEKRKKSKIIPRKEYAQSQVGEPGNTREK